MRLIRHHAAAIAFAVLALAASAVPALADTHTPPGSAMKAKTRVTTVIQKEMPLVTLTLSLRTKTDAAGFVAGGNVVEGQEYQAEGEVRDVHADRDQRPAKLEWVQGARLEADGHHQLGHGIIKNVLHITPIGIRSMKRGLASLRRANCDFERADAALGIRHKVPVITLHSPVAYLGPVHPFGDCS